MAYEESMGSMGDLEEVSANRAGGDPRRTIELLWA